MRLFAQKNDSGILFKSKQERLNQKLLGACGYQGSKKETVEGLLAAGADINVKGSDGGIALYLAAAFGYLDIARLLISNKADVNTRAEVFGSP